MKTVEWRELEHLVASIQRRLAPEAEVIHNARIRGHVTERDRQIDVLVKQRIGQYEMIIVIDCKDYKHPVDVKGVEEFRGLMTDAGAHKGVLVCPSGFSASAKKRAKGWGIDLYRPLDTGEHKWKATPFVSVLCKVWKSRISIGLAVSSPYPFTLREDPLHLAVFSADAIALCPPYVQALANWAEGEYDPEGPTLQDLPIYSIPTLVDNGNGLLVPASLSAHLEVEPSLYFGSLPIDDLSGFLDVQTGAVITNAFTTGQLDFVHVQNNWKKIKGDEDLPSKPLLTLEALECMEIRS